MSAYEILLCNFKSAQCKKRGWRGSSLPPPLGVTADVQVILHIFSNPSYTFQQERTFHEKFIAKNTLILANFLVWNFMKSHKVRIDSGESHVVN